MQPESFTDRDGITWKRRPVMPVRTFAIGVDLAQAVDRTCIAIVEYLVTGSDDWLPIKGQHGYGVLQEHHNEQFRVLDLIRLETGLTYGAIIETIHRIVKSKDVLRKADLVVDHTGCGRPVTDMLTELTGLEPILVTSIGASEEVHFEPPRHYKVPKSLMVATLSGLVSSSELAVADPTSPYSRATLRFRQDMPTAEILRDESSHFLRKQSQAGRATYDARSGHHDDALAALSLSLWWLNHAHAPNAKLQRPSYGAIKGLI